VSFFRIPSPSGGAERAKKGRTPIEKKEEQHKFEAKQILDEKITRKIVKSEASVSICGPRMVSFGPQTTQHRIRALVTIFCGPKEGRKAGGFRLTF
jgi:hypothetical protein